MWNCLRLYSLSPYSISALFLNFIRLWKFYFRSHIQHNFHKKNSTFLCIFKFWKFIQVWFSNRRARWRKQIGASQLPMSGTGLPGYSSLGAPTYMLPESSASLQSLPGLPTSALPGLGSLGQSPALANSTTTSTSVATSLPYSQFSNRFSFQNDQYSSVSIQ